ncbi:phospholipase/carboxylesterase [Bacillus sp. OV194]|nr:phospholipase/carboxylesterase [Bacillus sp. OV194]
MQDLVEDLKDDFILIGIRGNLTYENGYAYYYLKEYGKPERDLFDTSMKNLEDFIEYASAAYPIDPSNRYIIGFSQGAILSMSLALVLGDAIKGIVAMHGYIPSFVKEEYPIKSIKNLNVFITDGETDPIFPVQIGQENYNYLLEHSGSVKYITYPVGHEVSSAHKRDLAEWLSQACSNTYQVK